MASCGICREPSSYSRKFFCPSCASYLLLKDRISLINSSNERDELCHQVDKVLVHDLTYDSWYGNHTVDLSEKQPSKRHMDLLKSKIDALKAQISGTKQATEAIKDHTGKQCKQLQQIKEQNMEKKKRLIELNEKLDKEYLLQKSALITKSTSFAEGAKHDLGIITNTQLNLIKDLALVFGIRKRRKKKEKQQEQQQQQQQQQATSCSSPFSQRFDIIVGFSALPDFTKLVHYNMSTVNFAVERLSFFVALLANYLQVQLPFDLALPQRSHPYIRMGNTARGIKERTLYLKPHSSSTSSGSGSNSNSNGIQNLATQHAKEFEGYCEGLAMLSCCLAVVARRQGILVTTVEEHPKVNKILSKLYRTLVPRSSERVPRSTTPDLETSPAASVGDISEQLRLSAIRDYIVAQTYVEINGESSEWNLVEFEATVGSLVDLTHRQESE